MRRNREPVIDDGPGSWEEFRRGVDRYVQKHNLSRSNWCKQMHDANERQRRRSRSERRQLALEQWLDAKKERDALRA